MCGILGGFSITPIPALADAARLDRAIDSLAHRGPDDRGAYVAADRRAFLGHRRLSIIDVAGGHQPLVNETGRVRLCYNGEIYNFRRLRDELTARGHAFKTRSDGEPALHAYEDDPTGFIDRLSGMFALAVLDEGAGRLTLVRDRNGIKPLYYACDGRTLLFASELKAILALMDRAPTVSPHALRAFFRWKYVPSPLCIFEGIHKLPAACALVVERDGQANRLKLCVRRYWDVDYGRSTSDRNVAQPPPAVSSSASNEAAALDELDRRLRAAVESHLESDVEVGTLLSGGVDSSLVTALASILSGRRVKTFSVGFREIGFDQLPFARRLAEKYGTDHHEEHIDLDPMSVAATLARQFDEPFADSSALACYRVCQVAARHVKVVLTGDGGDETFAGYKRYEDILAAPPDRPGRRLARRLALAAPAALFSPEAKFVRHAFDQDLPPADRHRVRQYLFSDWLADRLLAEPFRHPSGTDVFEDHRRRAVAADWDDVQTAQYVDSRMYLPDDILTKVDRTSMACSLECRVPLLDHSITEFAASLPAELKVRGGVRKYLLKRLAERYVPPELLYRPKMGFRIPIRRWFKRGLLAETTALLRGGALESRGVLDRRGLDWLLRAQRRPWMDFGSQLWALLMAEHWAREYWK